MIFFTTFDSILDYFKFKLGGDDPLNVEKLLVLSRLSPCPGKGDPRGGP